MILIPKYAGFTDPQKPIHAGHIGYSGEVRCILYDINMNVKYDSGWAPNLITNNGLNRIRTSTYSFDYRTVIGDNATAATVTDTTLGNQLAFSSTAGTGNDSNTAGVAPNYEMSETSSKRFAAGVGTGTIRECALSGNQAGTDLFNRIVLPTPITKNADQVLDVIVRLTSWPWLGDASGTLTINSTSYNYLMRASDLPIANAGGGLSYIFGNLAARGSYASWNAYNGEIGVITGKPSGNQANADNGGFYLVNSPHVADVHEMTTQCFSGLNGHNTSTNQIRCLTGGWNLTRFQCRLGTVVGDLPVDKDNTQIMDMTWKVTWDRK
jgi:hypothetical protein